MMLYTSDNDDHFMPWAANIPPINGGNTSYMPPDLQLMPYVKNNQIWFCPSDSNSRVDPNTVPWWDGSYKALHLPRSYVYIGNIITNESGYSDDLNTGLSYYTGPNYWQYTGRSATAIDDVSNMVGWAEQWAVGLPHEFVGGIWGSGFIDCDTWKLAGRRVPTQGPGDRLPPACSSYNEDKPTPGHSNLGNYIFADGHAAAKGWGFVSKDDFKVFKAIKS